MRKILLALTFIILTACSGEVEEVKPTKPLAPIEIATKDYDSFTLKGKTYKLPASYQDFQDNGISIHKNEFFHDVIIKNQQIMTKLDGGDYDLGATFKNTSNEPINTDEGTIIEVYLNSENEKNPDFSISGLKWGDSFAKASQRLKGIHSEVAIMNSERTLNYYTDNNYVSLYFADDKLTSAAIFSKTFMRDQNYVAGEFVVFGQTVKFPLTIANLEDLLLTEFELAEEDEVLEPGDEVELKLYSPMFEGSQSSDGLGGLIFTITNNTAHNAYLKDSDIRKISTENSTDLSVGNIYIGASIDELKKMDRKNKDPKRLTILGKDDEGEVIFSFDAENTTSYLFKSNSQLITEIEVINKEQ